MKVDGQGRLVLPLWLRREIVSTPGEVMLRQTPDGVLLTSVSSPGVVETAPDGLPVLRLGRPVTNDEVDRRDPPGARRPLIDASVLLAALVADHRHHELARAHLRPEAPISAIVLAEAFSQLRRTFGQSAASAVGLLQPWIGDPERVLPTSPQAVGATSTYLLA